jgi:hypothetical protein
VALKSAPEPVEWIGVAQARIVAEHWPLVIVEWPAESSIAEIGAHFAEMKALMARRAGPFVAVVDATLPTTLDALLRAATARGLRDVSLAARGRIRGLAYVTPSTALRGVMTAIHWVVPSPAPMQMFDDRDEATAWVTGFLQVRTVSGVMPRLREDAPVDPRATPAVRRLRA